MTRPPALLMSASLVCAGLLSVAAAIGVAACAASDRAAAQVTLESAKRSARAQAEALRVAKMLAPRVAMLTEAGAFRQASRLDWAEVLEHAAAALQLPDLKWRIAAQMPLPGFAQLGLVTPVSLDLSLLHEGDLLRFEQWLHRHAPGPWQFQECELRAASGSAVANLPAMTPRVTARCELQAYSFHDTGGA